MDSKEIIELETISKSAAEDCDGAWTKEPKHHHFGTCTMFFVIVAIIGHVVNIGTDILTTYVLMTEGNIIWFILTIVVSTVPRGIVSIISLFWHWQDDHDCLLSGHEGSLMYTKSTKCTWTTRVITHLLFIGPISRYLDLIKYGYKAKKYCSNKPSPHLKKCADYYTRFVHEDRDCSLLALIESFLGDVPQSILQIYILLVRSDKDYDLLIVSAQVASTVSCMWSISAAMTNYHKAQRFALEHKKNLTPIGRVFQFLWRFGTISARVFALAVFASEFRNATFILVGAHWLLMWMWITCQNTRMCEDNDGHLNCFTERLFGAVMAGVLVTCYVNVKDAPTRIKYFVFYVIILAENSTMIVIWYLTVTRTYSIYEYRLHVLVGTIVSFFIGIFFMLIYYRRFHPNGKMPANDKEADLF